MTVKAWNVVCLFQALGIFLCLGANNVQAAGREGSNTTETPVAGMEVTMEQFQKSGASLTQEKMKYGIFTSIFQNLGVAMVEDSLNIREEPKNNAGIVGKMNRHAGCSVLSEKNGWYQIKSGPVTGYVYGKYLATGQAARETAYYDMKLMVRVNTKTLRVRSGPGTDSEIIGRIYEGETYEFLSSKAGWAKIAYAQEGFNHSDSAGASGEEKRTGYVYVPGNALIAYTIPEAVKNNDLRSQVVNYAVKFVGNPYRWGGTNPNTGADCSGFVQYVMEHAAGVRLDRTSRQQAREGEAVPASSMEPGDLLFYSSGSEINHVAMYIGEGKIVHAANQRSGIKISAWNYRKPVTIRRVIP